MKNFMGMDGFIWFMGVVEDHNDPEQIGRVRVRCLGIHTEDKETLPTDDLPWSMVMMPTTSASVSQIGHSPSGLLKGSWVMGFFRDGEGCQEPVVMGSFHGYPIERPNTNLGFADPTGVNPVEIDEPDTSRLARADKKSKVFTTRSAGINEGHRQDGEGPNGKTSIGKKNIAWSSETWTPSAIPFNPRYPFNKVYQTESGHALEFDDTPDNERILLFHRKDTFIELHPDGTIQIHSFKNAEVLVDENFNIEAKGAVNIFTQGKTTVYAKDNIDMQSEKDVQIKCVNFKVEAQTNITQTCGQTMDLNAGANIDADAPRIDLN
jgi:hypothetical protein